MNEHVIAQLDDYIDGALPQAESAALQAHLEVCPSCAAAHARLASLLAGAAALPRSIEPPAEVWAAVRARTVDARPSRWAMLWSLRYPLAAAAVALIVITSLATMLLTRQPPSVALSPNASVTLAALAEAEQEYKLIAAGLEQTLQQRQGDVDPATLRIVRENLRIIDRAINDAHAALQRDPRDAALPRLISRNHQRKIDMLERTLRLSSEL
jgi:anti-sigma factor RsiW